jgi:hypothetical protein
MTRGAGEDTVQSMAGSQTPPRGAGSAAPAPSPPPLSTELFEEPDGLVVILDRVGSPAGEVRVRCGAGVLEIVVDGGPAQAIRHPAVPVGARPEIRTTSDFVEIRIRADAGMAP